MRTAIRASAVLLSVLLGGAGLAGCTSGAPAETGASPVASSETSDPPARDTAVGATVEGQLPDTCAALSLTPGGQLSGAAFAPCLSDVLAGFGSGRLLLTGPALSGDLAVAFGEGDSFQGALTDAQGPMTITLLDGTLWIDRGTGAVRGDVNSEDPQAQRVGIAGELYRSYADVHYLTDMIAAQPTWTVAEETEPLATPAGDIVNAYRIDSDGAVALNGLSVDGYTLWLAEDWTPLASRASLTLDALAGEYRLEFVDLGAPVDIHPVG